MWDKKLKNQTIKKKLSRWMTVVCSFLLAVGLGFSVGRCGGRIFPGKQGNPGTDESSADEKSICGRYAGRNLYGNGRSTDS